jgi:hypothetical protein
MVKEASKQSDNSFEDLEDDFKDIKKEEESKEKEEREAETEVKVFHNAGIVFDDYI